MRGIKSTHKSAATLYYLCLWLLLMAGWTANNGEMKEKEKKSHVCVCMNLVKVARPAAGQKKKKLFPPSYFLTRAGQVVFPLTRPSEKKRNGIQN